MTFALITITLLSLLLAGVMSAVAWTAVTRERRRSESRVAALKAAIDDVPIATYTPMAEPAPVSLRPNALFAVGSAADERRRVPIAVAAGTFIVAGVITVAIAASSASRPAASAPPGAAAVVTPAEHRAVPRNAGASESVKNSHAPIELIELQHERRGDRLEVRGLVYNPQGGVRLSHLSATVLLFDAAGLLLATDRASIDASELAPGHETRFALEVPADHVARYRVSFKQDDTVVPHVDKRHGA